MPKVLNFKTMKAEIELSEHGEGFYDGYHELAGDNDKYPLVQKVTHFRLSEGEMERLRSGELNIKWAIVQRNPLAVDETWGLSAQDWKDLSGKLGAFLGEI